LTHAPAIAFSHRRAGHRHLASIHYLGGAMRLRSPRLMVRAIGVLFGERAMRARASARPRGWGERRWLKAYRSEG
jgi:hypothetical protein